jgi:endonuclease I
MSQLRTRSLLGAVGVLTISAAASGGSVDPWAPPGAYYDAATGTGATLKNQLYTIMRSGHIQRSYGDFRESAAIHDADPDRPGNIILGYNRASVPAGWDQGATWNREHVWPQSRQPGSASNSTRGNLGDPHALRPMNPSVNGSRGNKPLGLADTIGPHRSMGVYYFVGEMDRGDIARSLFYSETRYGPELGLELVGSFPSSNQMGDMPCLLAWHYLDPPDEFERRRNHAIFSSSLNPQFYTNNRNAFVDHPEFVWSVYVDQANDARLYVGDAPAADGGSVALIDGGEAFVGDPAPEAATVTLRRDGDDGVYFRAVALDDAALESSALGAFAIDGADETTLEVGFDPAVMSVSGVKQASVMIDNLDVTTGGGPGRGARDADDLATVELAVYDRAEASFDPARNRDDIVVNFGEIEQHGGAEFREIFIYNLPAGELTAELDVEFGYLTGDAGRFSTDLDGENGISTVDPLAVIVGLNDDVAGDFGAILTYRVFDDRSIPGAQEGQEITIAMIGAVRAACAGDLNGSGVVDAADLAMLVAGWGGVGAADLDGDGAVGASDLAALVASWGACE